MINRKFNSYGFNNGVKQPCDRNCPDREVGCHSKCEKYKKFLEENEVRKKQIAETKEANSVINGYNPNKKNLSSSKMRKKEK